MKGFNVLAAACVIVSIGNRISEDAMWSEEYKNKNYKNFITYNIIAFNMQLKMGNAQSENIIQL